MESRNSIKNPKFVSRNTANPKFVSKNTPKLKLFLIHRKEKK